MKKFTGEIEKTIKPYIKIKLEEQKTMPWESKLGGYPAFTQCDPRYYDKNLERFNTLLLQLDCEDECDLMFGDTGVANFFINEEDLKKLDFTKVLYNWDCC